MSWISENSAAISALGSIAMNVSTVAIIFFNMHQFKLNRSSLNIEINFRLFEQRKRLYNDLLSILELLKTNGNFVIFTEEKEGMLATNARFAAIKEMIDDSEYLFSGFVYVYLCELLDLFMQGISLETQMHDIKTQDVQNWTDQTTNTLKQLSERSKLILMSIQQFDINMVAEYLNISLFNKDFIGDKRSFKQNRFSKVLLAVKEQTNTLIEESKERIQF